MANVHDTTIEVCDVHNVRLETVHPSCKEEDRVINHLGDESQSPESTENVASYHSRGTVKSLDASIHGHRIAAMVGISGTMDQDAMTTERQGRPVACSQGLPRVYIGDGVGGEGIARCI